MIDEKKLIERLEKCITDSYYRSVGGSVNAGIENCIYHELKIFVNQLTEEYNNKSVNGDLISRCDVMEMLTNIELSCTIIPITEAKLQLRDIPSVQSAYNNGWIPCSERLPEKFGAYLVSRKGCSRPDISLYNEKFKQWSWEDVIAWQPLPEPYQPKGE